MSTMNNYTALALFIEDITSSPLSWKVCALAYAGNNLRTCLQMFHVLDIYAYSYSKKPTISTREHDQTTPGSSIG